MFAEINTEKDRVAAFENRYRIDVILKKRLIKKSIFLPSPINDAENSAF